MDVVLCVESLATRLIEINPFICSGSALFRWTDPEDRQILHSGRAGKGGLVNDDLDHKDVEMRILSAVVPCSS
jgi:hypothetical protein